ncbi:DNA primase [Patescibacteria group bacterium]|nr:DNA primase [Patescibacteria group bacterium]
MDSPTQDIKSRVDVADLISDYVELQKAGTNFKACCPFHGEDTPSFFVSPEKQIWHCFGCSKGGDIFTFIEEAEGVDFKEALKILADRAGVTIKKQDPKVYKAQNRSRALMDLTTLFFKKALAQSKSGEVARRYLKERGISKESIDLFDLGYSPDSYTFLSDFLQKKGYTKGEILRAGLSVEKQDKTFYDRFRQRLMFPISDVHGYVVGYGGRILTKDTKAPKYLNSPETSLYHKSTVLYGFDLAKGETREKDFIVLVEGYTDVIASHQAGVTNVVASSGTALTIEQIRLIKRFTQNVYLCFDMDSAGQQATRRGVDLALREGLTVKIVSLPDGKDPDELIRIGKEKWLRAIKEAKNVIEYYMNKSFVHYDSGDVDRKKEIFSELIPLLSEVQNKVEQSHFVGLLAKKLNVAEKIVFDALQGIKTPRAGSGEKQRIKAKQQSIQKDTMREVAEQALAMIIRFPDLRDKVDRELLDEFLKEEDTALASREKEVYTAKHTEDAKERQSVRIEELSMQLELQVPEFKKVHAAEGGVPFLANNVQRLRKASLQKRLDSIATKMEQAEESGSSEDIEALNELFKQVAQELLQYN